MKRGHRHTFFGEYTLRFPDAIAKLIEVGVDDFEAKSLTIKRKEILQIGVKRGIPQGAQQILLRQIATRFGKLPSEIRRRTVSIKDSEELDRIADALLTMRSLAELKKAL